MQYYDAETHVAMLKTKHERLLALLSKSETMEDIIALQNALSDCEYELEQYEGTLRHYDDLVGFSTIRLGLSEVPGLSAVPSGVGLGSELRTAASSGLHGLTSVLRGVLIGLVTAWPLVLLLLILCSVALVAYRKRRKADARKQDASEEEKPS